MSNILPITYAINQENEIIFVNEAWSEFASANNAPELAAEKVLNCNLWDFISDDLTRELYTKLIDKARAGHSINFNFRCDSPDFRRFFVMEISLRADQNIQFATRLINVERRIDKNVSQPDALLNGNLIVICSWCQKIEMSDGSWHELEEILSILKLFESAAAPQMSHGMCIACYQSISEKHRDTFAPQTGVE